MRESVAACGEILCDMVSLMLVLTRILNFRIRTYWIRYGLSVLVLAVGCSIVFLDSERQWYGFIYMGVLFTITNILLDEKIGKRIAVAISMICLVEAVNVLLSSMLEIILKLLNVEGLSLMTKLVAISLGTLLFVIVLAHWTRKITNGVHYSFPILYYIIISLFLMAEILAVELFYYQLKHSSSVIYMVLAWVMYLGMIMEVVIMIGSLVSKYRYKEISLINAKSLEMQKKHFQRLRDIDEETRKLRHDIKNHLRAVGVLAHENKTEEVCRYIERLEAKLAKAEGLYCVNNDIVDAIINETAIVADRKGIKFSVKGRLPVECHIECVDLCTIFSNLLINAIEACKRTKGEAEISLEIRTYNDEIFITQQNTKPNECVEGKTWKTDERNHGFGLKNIRESVEKYNGKVSISAEKGCFCLHILLKNRELVENRRLLCKK